MSFENWVKENRNSSTNWITDRIHDGRNNRNRLEFKIYPDNTTKGIYRNTKSGESNMTEGTFDFAFDHIGNAFFTEHE